MGTGAIIVNVHLLYMHPQKKMELASVFLLLRTTLSTPSANTPTLCCPSVHVDFDQFQHLHLRVSGLKNSPPHSLLNLQGILLFQLTRYKLNSAYNLVSRPDVTVTFRVTVRRRHTWSNPQHSSTIHQPRRDQETTERTPKRQARGGEEGYCEP
jgi:hypothetical protein